ncbi:MAG: 8-amino-7-oxononanoate synthase [PVC group bacterium]|nr:8-amino-7-oxononanoate synthase [PVC group bacterium]
MENIDKLLQFKKEQNLLRTLYPADMRKQGRIGFGTQDAVDFSSNDYLGLSSHPALKAAFQAAGNKFGVGTAGSRLLSGDLKIHHQLEERIAVFKGKERALVYNSGYQANISIISALVTKQDVVFMDKLSHASIIDGIKLSGARFFRFQHNDVEHLERLLKKERNKFKDAFIITETIFSMDGDRCPLQDLVSLKKQYNCRLYIDEAHATGIFGERGSGLAELEGVSADVDFIMGTFSKALGSFGAYIAASSKVIEYLINASRGFIYTTALPAAVMSANLAALDLVEQESFRRKVLLENAVYFREELKKRGFQIKGDSQIVPWVVGDSERAMSLSRDLRSRGYWVLPIRPPTVPAGEARLRFSLNYDHDKETLKKLINEIAEIKNV